MVKNRPFCIICLFFMLPLYAGDTKQPKGVPLCTEISHLLSSTGCTYYNQQLVAPGTNNFPQNIIANFPTSSAPKKQNPDNRSTLIIAFTMEDAYIRKDAITELIKTIQKTPHDYCLKLLFSYGDSSAGSRRNRIEGTPIFVQQEDNPDDCTAVCISLSSKKNAYIIPGGKKNISPKWLVIRLTNALSSENLPFRIQGGIVCSLYHLGILENDRRTSFFLANAIPCAGLSFPESTSDEMYVKILSSFISSYTINNTAGWERHYIPVKIGNSVFFSGERFIVFSFILTAFTTLFILCELSFMINLNKNQIFQDVTRLWYILPITLVLSVISFELSQPFALLIYRMFHANLYMRFAVKTAVSFGIVALMYTTGIKKQADFSEKAYAYLLSVIAVFNIFLFSTIDISFFFLFTFELIIIYSSRPIKNYFGLILTFFTMIIPFLPFFYQIIQYADPAKMNMLVTARIKDNILLAFAFLPFQIQWLRILASLNSKWNSKSASPQQCRNRTFISFACASAVFFILIIGITAHFTAHESILPEKKDETYAIKNVTDKFPIVMTSGRTFFGETVRTVEIDLGSQTEECMIMLKSNATNPVLYSENQYQSDKNSRTDTFLVPPWPPQHLSFSYVTDNSISEQILITALYPDYNGHLLRHKNIFIPATLKKDNT
jgi:hypothetical protein